MSKTNWKQTNKQTKQTYIGIAMCRKQEGIREWESLTSLFVVPRGLSNLISLLKGEGWKDKGLFVPSNIFAKTKKLLTIVIQHYYKHYSSLGFSFYFYKNLQSRTKGVFLQSYDAYSLLWRHIIYPLSSTIIPPDTWYNPSIGIQWSLINAFHITCCN